MNFLKQDISQDKSQGANRGELVSLMEPLSISADSRFRDSLNDLAVDLAAKSAGFCQSVPKKLVPALTALVRRMNCYYSNLIEGHDTHPVDIERALKNDYSSNTHKRNLQLEAGAHIKVQTWIDEGGLADQAATSFGLLEIHQRFCSFLPEDLLWVKDTENKTRIRITPGTLRENDVKVGRHIPVSPGVIPMFLERFESVYAKPGRLETIISAAAAHHRLLWIHPFLDGNGRVARLMSHAMLLKPLHTGGIWSVARGLARNEQRYKELLTNCDQPRRNDLDGRGNLSEEALVEFTRFFLKICLDQIAFMESLMQPDQLKERIISWAQREIQQSNLPHKSARLIEAVLYSGGSLPRSDAAKILDVGSRQARRIVAELMASGALVSKSSRAPLYLNFSARLTGEWMPGLFP
jgi:Fic family protein